MCTTHYQQARRQGRVPAATCTVGTCDNIAAGRGLCGSHYYRWKNDLDMDAPWRQAGEWGEWAANSKGYIYRRKTLPDGRRVAQFQHQLVMEEHIGRSLTKGEEVHHKNGVRDDNRLENLEIWSTRQPKGQRWDDKVDHAVEILKLYRPDLLA